MTELTSFDKSLLNLLQGNLPVCSHPFAALAEKLDTDEQTVLNRKTWLWLQRLQKLCQLPGLNFLFCFGAFQSPVLSVARTFQITFYSKQSIGRIYVREVYSKQSGVLSDYFW